MCHGALLEAFEPTTRASDVFCGFSGATDQSRTDDLRFTKPLLYQLSYGGIAVAPDGAAMLVA